MAQSCTAESLSRISLNDFRPLAKLPSFFPGLYVLFSAAGKVLYIGQSKDVPARLKRHARERKWWPEVDTDRTVAYMLAGTDSRLHLEALLQLWYRPRHCRAIKIGIKNDGTLYELQFLR